MKRPNFRKRYIFLTFVLLVVGGLVLACFLWVRAEQRQYAMNRELIDSLVSGDVPQALDLVEAGANPNTRFTPPPPPTWRELLTQLVKHSSTPSNNRPTAFMIVCGDKHTQVVPDAEVRTIPERTLRDPALVQVARAMILHGANVNARDSYGMTALMWASDYDLTGQMVLLLEHGALIDSQSDTGFTALHITLFKEKVKTVKILLKYHANPNLKTFGGITPLNMASRPSKPSPEIIHLLKAAGATK